MPKIQNLRTSTASKRPTAVNLDPGVIAINYEKTDPAIYFTADDGSLIKVAPLYIGSTAPNATPAGSSGNSTGEMWLDTSNGGKILRYWDGDSWEQVTASTITDVLGPTLGGTGQSTWTLGDLLYSNGSNTLAKLAGNTTTTKQFLTQTGTGTVSAAPSWGTVTKSDVGLGSVENTALSTWAGSTSITTLGTIATGTVPWANVGSKPTTISGYGITDAPTLTGNNTLSGANTLTIAAGSAAAPSLYPTGDSNTGIYSPGADQVSVATGGVERLRVDSAGQIEAVSLGSAAAPTFSFTGDPNTGIYSPGADQLAVSTGGTQRLTVDASGNLGLGVVPSAWSGPVNGTGFRVFQASRDASFGGADGGAVCAFMAANVYATGTDASVTATWRYKLTGSLASRYEQLGGQHLWYTAPSGTAGDAISFSQVMTLNASGNLLLGTTSARSAISNTSLFQIEGTTLAGSSASIICNTNDTSGGRLTLGKSRGTSLGSNTVVQSGDNLGAILFAGANGTNLANTGASIAAVVDATPGSGDMPSRLVFSTTADGAGTPTEAFRITNDRVRVYNQAAPAAIDTSATATIANLKTGIVTSSTAAAVTITLPTGTDCDGGFTGLYNDMAFEWAVINTGATNAVTVAASTGHTIVGSATVAASNSGRFLTRRTGANTWVTYRLSS